MRRLLPCTLVLALLGLGAWMAPGPAGSGAWSPLVRALGPLRAVWADVLLIQFDERSLQQDVFALAEHARRILRLRPDLPAYHVYFGQYLALDLASLEADPALRRERVRQGLAVLRDGEALLPRAAVIPAALADTLLALESAHPDWLQGSEQDAVGQAFDAYRRADRRAPEGPGRDWAVRLRLFLEGLLGDPGRLPGREEEVREFARELLQRPGLSPEAATALRRALERAG